MLSRHLHLEVSGRRMLDVIILTSLSIVGRTERLVGELSRQCSDLHNLQNELDLLADVALVLEDAARLLRRTFETRPEIARGIVHATLQ
jgi:hypothetical protein